MCNLGGFIGLGQGYLQAQAQLSAYDDGVDRYYENKERVGRSSIIKYNKLGIRASQEELVRSQKTEKLQSSTNKAMARAANTGSSAGLMAGRALAINQQSVQVESSKVGGRIDQESTNALMAFGLAGQDIFMTGEYNIAAAHPGSPPDGGMLGLGMIFSGLGGYLSEAT